MKIKIMSLFPNMFDGFMNESITKRAIDKGLLEFEIVDWRKYTTNKHRRVDDYPFGGGKGMLLMVQPIVDCLRDIKGENSKVFLMSPQGKRFSQSYAVDLSKEEELIFVCGHYEGFDERIRDYVDGEISIGDYVLTGGELPAMVIADSISRMIPGVIKEHSYVNDTHYSALVDHPSYTHPRDFEGNKVPEVLLSGNHKKISDWRLEQSIKKTQAWKKNHS